MTVRRWTDFTTDPNAKEALAARQATLDAARAEPIADRTDYLIELARGKRVLDVGVGDHTVESGQRLHRAIAKAASHCLGVDILEPTIRRLQSEGFNVRVADVTKDPIGETFDVMICGEVVEHLDDPGGLFRAAAKCLDPGGVVVLTTPNPFYLPRIRDALRAINMDNVDHVTLFSPSGLAELGERQGMSLARYRGVGVTNAQSVLGSMALQLKSVMQGVGISPEAFCNTLIYEFRRS